MGIGGKSAAKDASNEKPPMAPTHSLTRPHTLYRSITTTWGLYGGNRLARRRRTSTIPVRRGCSSPLNWIERVESYPSGARSSRAVRAVKQHLTTSPPLSNKFGAPGLQRGSGGSPSADRRRRFTSSRSFLISVTADMRMLKCSVAVFP